MIRRRDYGLERWNLGKRIEGWNRGIEGENARELEI